MGNAGDDMIFGGKGSDTLSGGRGVDLFVFRNLNERGDTIKDFDHDELIDLRSIFNTAKFSAETPFQQFTQFIKLQQSQNNVEVVIDRNGIASGANYVTLVTLENVSIDDVKSQNFVL